MRGILVGREAVASFECPQMSGESDGENVGVEPRVESRRGGVPSIESIFEGSSTVDGDVRRESEHEEGWDEDKADRRGWGDCTTERSSPTRSKVRSKRFPFQHGSIFFLESDPSRREAARW